MFLKNHLLNALRILWNSLAEETKLKYANIFVLSQCPTTYAL